jgi:hypothetical protein
MEASIGRGSGLSEVRLGMLKLYPLGQTYLASGWVIHPLAGSLIRVEPSALPKMRVGRLPAIVDSALDHCRHPFSLAPPGPYSPTSPNCTSRVDPDPRVETLFRRIGILRRVNFFSALIYASVRDIRADDSVSAMDQIGAITTALTTDACLEKCLTVAKCSATFKDRGVIFIGAHLPLRAMHAWIIEGDVQPDSSDRAWINFLPLMAITHHAVRY